jgi:hypothetical protein
MTHTAERFCCADIFTAAGRVVSAFMSDASAYAAILLRIPGTKTSLRYSNIREPYRELRHPFRLLAFPKDHVHDLHRGIDSLIRAMPHPPASLPT